MESAEAALQEERSVAQPEAACPPPAAQENGAPLRIEPDLDFIWSLHRRSGVPFKMCMQCGTCSATCSIFPDSTAFPRKEMAWAVWGMKEQLVKDPDVWLCHQCNDCSARCPRGARPGEVLSVVRRESVAQFALPRFLGNWVNQPQCVPLLLGIATALLTLALLARDPIADLLGIQEGSSAGIHFSYSRFFPHWLLNGFFLLFGALALAGLVVSVRRLWRALESGTPASAPRKPLFPSLLVTLRRIVTHEEFAKCTAARPRRPAHMLVVFGFVALTLVTLWVITAKINPLVRGEFLYPFSFWNPWKVLANLGGAAVLLGCSLMIWERIRNDTTIGAGRFFDWALLATIVLTVLTGYATEILHYVRLEPHRHVVYFVHLVFVFSLLMYLPYSKLAHIVYRTTAMVFAERTGRLEEKSDVEDTSAA